VDGIICTDAGSLRNMIKLHKYYPNLSEGRGGRGEGGHQPVPGPLPGRAVNDALKEKLLTEAEIDEVLKGEFRVMIRLGHAGSARARGVFQTGGRRGCLEAPGTRTWPAGGAGIGGAAEERRRFLPLDRSSKLKSIAVIGPRANQVLLDWYSGTPPYTVTPLEGHQGQSRLGMTVNYAANNDNDAAVKAAKAIRWRWCLSATTPPATPVGRSARRPATARKRWTANGSTWSMEELVKQVYAANPKTVMVLVSSFPFAINWSQQNLPAILHMTHNAQEMGTAIADVLFGDYNPGGRLVQTFPQSLDQVPAKMDYDIRHGRTYMYFQGDPLYPFGYGLSYSTFRYSNLKTSAATLRAGGEITVSVDVTNTGKRQGDEVVQLYVKHINSGVDRPLRELKGFHRVTLAPGQTRTVTLPLKAETLAYWDMARQRWDIEADQLSLIVGSSSEDKKLDKTIAVVR
jgi:beta-glucosidase